MPLPGGTSDKLGNRYEGRWTALAILEVLRDEATAIRLEPPGDEGEGVEFYVRYTDHTDFHQVKRQRTAGDWTIAALRRAGVLQTFVDKLSDVTSRCTFVSGHSVSSLEDLTTKARSSLSWAEFERHFVISRDGKDNLTALRDAFRNPTESVLLEMLRRIRVESISEDLLRSYASLQAEMVLEGDQAQALPVLVEIALNNVNRYLTADLLWRELAAYSFKPSMWTRPTQVAVHVNHANERYAESRRATLIQDEMIPRVEAKQIVDALANHRLVLVDGIAGMGKSDVILQLVEDLHAREIPHLVFRLDQVTPTRRPDELGRDLGLPGSPAAVLAAVAHDREAVLVIDQLDAVSAASGRNPQFLDCVSDIVRTAQSSRTLRVVLVCRTFDVENDARLRQVIERNKDHLTITVGLLDRTVVKQVLWKLGYGEGTLRETQIELLRVPLHLALLAGAVENEPGSFDFETSLDLHHEFWDRKRRDIGPRLGADAWVGIVERLVDYMSEQQVLQAPAAIVDHWELYADAMVSENVLTRDGRKLAFFHETFFDYAFARTFIGRQRSMRTLLSADQYLFRRAQVRQILAHEQLLSGKEYRRDLSYLIQDPEIRFHLKELVISWLSQIEPTSFEWSLIEPLLLDQESRMFGRAWRLLLAPGWFAHADGVGFIAKRLRSEDNLTEQAASIVAAAATGFPERAVELFRPFANDPRWANRIGRVVSQVDLALSRSLFELALTWVEQFPPTMDGDTTAQVGHTIRELAKRNPRWACELLARFLRRRVALARDCGLDNPFDAGSETLPSNLHLEGVVSDLGTDAPTSFIEHIWPVMLEVLEHRGSPGESNGLRRDPIWSHRHLGVPSLEESLLIAAEAGFAHVAKAEREFFERLLGEHGATEFETVVYLLYQGFAAEPAGYADMAIEFLLTDQSRLRVGYSNGGHWGTHRLLESISPFASAESLRRLEEVLLAYNPDLRWANGMVQFELLGGIAKERRSPAVKKRISELQRKFEQDEAPAPQGIVGGTVRSPIAPAAASKMTDNQWRGAIGRYSSAHRDREWGGDFLKGGAEELAHVLQEEAKQHPERFSALGMTLPDEAHDAYFDAILRGVADADPQPALDTLVRLIERCHRIPGHPCGRFISSPVAKHVASDLPEELLEIIGWYAVNDPDPRRDGNENEAEGFDLMTVGLNCVRGAVASAIAELVSARPQRFESLRDAIFALCSDRAAAVRAMAGRIVCSLVARSPELAQLLFMRLVDSTDDRVLASHFVYTYLLWQTSDDLDVLQPVLERMIASSVASVRQAGAAHLTLAALRREDARAAADRCETSGDLALRLGATQVFAANLRTKEHSERCALALTKLFNDESPQVWSEAAKAFWRMEGVQLGEHLDLATSFVASRAFEGNAHHLVHALRETAAAVPALILATCKRALDAFEVNRRGPLARDASDALGFVLRAYADTDDPAEKNRVVDLVDRALLLNIYGPHKLLAEHDRWWDKS